MPDIFIASKEAKDKKNAPAKNVKPRRSVAAEKRNAKVHDKGKRSTLKGIKKHEHNPFSSFSYYPREVKFINEDPEEKIILLLRKHPITNLKWITTSFFWFIAPSFATILPLFDSIPLRFRLVGYVMWYLVLVAYIFEKFLSWFFHVNIITDERIIEVDFHHILYREMTDANIDHIEDVTVEMSGAVRTYFNFGRVDIQTAAEVPKIDFNSVPHPDKVARILRDLRIEEEIEKIEGRVR